MVSNCNYIVIIFPYTQISIRGIYKFAGLSMKDTQTHKISSSFIQIFIVFISTIITILTISYKYFVETDKIFVSFLDEEISLMNETDNIYKKLVVLKSEVFIYALERSNNVARENSIKNRSKNILDTLEMTKKNFKSLNDKKIDNSLEKLSKDFKNFYILAKDIADDFKDSYEDGIDTLNAIESIVIDIDKDYEVLKSIILDRVNSKDKKIKESINLAINFMLLLAVISSIISLIIYTKSIKIKKIAKYMENVIRDRTEKLEEQKDELEQIITNLHQTQDQLIKSEKMASLGQLIAGVAHEINTPIGAIKSSSESINHHIIDILASTTKTLTSVDEDKKELFFEILSNIFDTYELSTKEERTLRKEVEKKLNDLNININKESIKCIIKLRIHDDLEKYKDILNDTQSQEIMRSATKVVDLINNSKNISIAVDRVSKVVFALKTFSKIEESAKKVTCDIAKNIEDTLKIYNNDMKKGVNIIKEYENIDNIECYHDGLKQVWTNLIQNALHAMEYKGDIKISIKDKNSNIEVSIQDSGHGIAEDIQDKIFEPFFTTKRAGEGSGIGLDITRKIVSDFHGGSISFVSKEGKGSTFTVVLPK
jgi:signal transduction histidine kinase